MHTLSDSLFDLSIHFTFLFFFIFSFQHFPLLFTFLEVSRQQPCALPLRSRVPRTTTSPPLHAVHTPRTCLLRAVSVPLCNAPGKDWNHEEELKGVGFGRMPALGALHCRWAMNSLMLEKDNRRSVGRSTTYSTMCSGSIPD